MAKLKLIRQHDAMECGIASLAMICSYYGKDISLSSLSKICFSTKDGSSLLGITDAASSLGFETISGYLSIQDIREIKKPLILHWQQNHFVVLYKISEDGNKFFIADPAKGKIKCSLSEMQQCWLSTTKDGIRKGIATYMQPTSSFEQSKDNSHTGDHLKIIKRYIDPYKKHLFHIFIGLILGSLLQLCLPFLTQWIVDIGVARQSIKFVWLVLLGEFLIIIGRSATDFIRRWLLLHISMRINISLVSDFFIKLLKLPMSFFDVKMRGDLLQRISDHSRVQSFLTSQILGLMYSMLNFVVFGIVLLVYDKIVFSIFMIGSIFYGVWISVFLKRRRILDYELFSRQAAQQEVTYQFVSNVQEIKLQNCEKRRRWEWEDVQADLFLLQMKSLQLQQRQEAGSIFINEIKNILITVFAASSVIHGSISLGVMLAIQYIVGQLNSPIEQFMAFIYSFQDVKISLERINEIHNRKEEAVVDQIMLNENFKKKIRLTDVSFKYNPHSTKNDLDGVTFDIPEGKVTAIVGASGSGKTTLDKLLLGYYPVCTGGIFIDDTNINVLNLKEWRKKCGVVMQDGVIFSESIARNIAADDGDIDFQRMEYAAKVANIHKYTMNLPLQYNTKIGADGIGLSQGQKQRILIARAVYKNPHFIFLDEATNSLDAKNERLIVRNLNEFYSGKTVIIVAHRLSTVKSADQIVVLDEGKVVEVGDHLSLTERRGTYYNLVRNQLNLGN